MSESPTLTPPSANELPWVLESLLFVADEPQPASTLAAACGVSEGAVRRALARLRGDYEARGLRLMDDGQRYQIVTAPEYGPYIDALLGRLKGERLTRAALEVLTIIAYKQPCTRSEIEAIRGVNSDKLVATLEMRGLVEQSGTADSPGRPKLFRTTMRFLEHFGIASASDLPPLPDAEPDETADPL